MEHRLAIIVLVYNSFEDAQSCVNQLLSFSLGLRIVLVDNCSTDGSFVRLNDLYKEIDDVDVISTDCNHGYSAGNNYGIRYAAEHYDIDTVAVMNPDVLIPGRDVLTGLTNLLWDFEDCLAVGGQPINHLDHDRRWPSSWSLPSKKELIVDWSLLSRKPLRNDAVEIRPCLFKVDCIVGCFFLTKLEMFSSIGLFDESVFLYNEENLLGFKCRQAGYSLLVDTSRIYYHNHHVGEAGKSVAADLATYDASYKSRRYLLMRYYPPFLRLPLWVVKQANNAAIALIHVRHKVLSRIED